MKSIKTLKFVQKNFPENLFGADIDMIEQAYQTDLSFRALIGCRVVDKMTFREIGRELKIAPTTISAIYQRIQDRAPLFFTEIKEKLLQEQAKESNDNKTKGYN